MVEQPTKKPHSKKTQTINPIPSESCYFFRIQLINRIAGFISRLGTGNWLDLISFSKDAK